MTVTDHPIPVALASAVARVLAQRFGGDLGSADASHLGRAPGFVNRKPVHENPAAAGRFPWVHLRSASAGVCPRGVEILAEGQALLDTRVSRPPGPTCSVRPTSGVLSLDAAACAAARWRLGFAVLLPPGQRVDRSRIDHSVARHLLRAGAAPAVVADVLRGGDRAQEMQPARRDAYVQRTVEAALAAHREVRR